MTVHQPTNDSSARMVGYSATYVRLWSVLVSMLDAIGSEYQTLLPSILETMDSFIVVQAPDWRLPWFEEMLGLSIGDNLTRVERESRILARLQAWQPATQFNLHAIANKYPNGQIEAIMDPDTWTLTYRFVSLFGRPTNIDDLQHELLRASDAHVYVVFEFRYLLRGEWRETAVTRGAVKTAGRTRGVLKTMRPEDLP